MLVGHCRRHCDCTIGTQWPNPHLRRLPPMRRPTLATNSTPADVAVLPVPHAWGQKQQASASGKSMGKYAPGARLREEFSGNHSRPAHKLRLPTPAGTVKSRLGAASVAIADLFHADRAAEIGGLALRLSQVTLPLLPGLRHDASRSRGCRHGNYASGNNGRVSSHLQQVRHGRRPPWARALLLTSNGKDTPC